MHNGSKASFTYYTSQLNEQQAVPRKQRPTHTSHHIHRLFTDFVYQRVSKFETDAMFPGDRAVKLYRPFLNPGDDFFSNPSLTFGADDDGVVVACQMFLAEKGWLVQRE